MDFLTILFGIIVLIFSATIHEVAHGVAAVRLGDPTPKIMGRITLNPLKHLSWWGSIILPAILIIFRSPIIFGWAKPMPFNPRNIPDKKWGPVKVALAGPASNILLALIFSLIAWILVWVHVIPETLLIALSLVVIINISLALFNLIPLPPLDGHYLLYALIPYTWKQKLEQLRGYSIIFTLVAVLVLWQLFFPLVLIIYRLLMPIGFPL